MVKITISKDQIDITGEVKQGVVKPFGTSGHLNVEKKHLGKIVSVVIPDKPRYTWILTNVKKKEVITSCKKIAKELNGKIEFHRLGAIDNFNHQNFTEHDLLQVIGILELSEKDKKLVDEIKSTYGFK